MHFSPCSSRRPEGSQSTQQGSIDSLLVVIVKSHVSLDALTDADIGDCFYRTTVEEGGETVFPNAQTKVTGPEWSDCAKQGLAVKTKRGDALLFFRSAFQALL